MKTLADSLTPNSTENVLEILPTLNVYMYLDDLFQSMLFHDLSQFLYVTYNLGFNFIKVEVRVNQLLRQACTVMMCVKLISSFSLKLF